jgi:4-methyl-5(b-hydroxyethyl)-thiazole monophosphate biosynthesis
MSSSETVAPAKKRVLVPICDGSEEIETTCITDTLVRCGAEVVLASVHPDGNLKCKMSRGVNFLADMTIAEASTQSWDLIALPGGMPGASHLAASAQLTSLLQNQISEKKLYGAICAAPAVALASQNMINEAGATCYPAPAFRDALEGASDDKVVVQGNLVTSQGPGTALLFGLQLGEELFGKEVADKVAKEMLVER